MAGYNSYVYSWEGQSDLVFSTLFGDFMKPRIKEVINLYMFVSQ